MFDRKLFMQEVRGSIFRGRFSRTQAEGLDALLTAWERDYARYPLSFLAYCLATAYHETAATLQPIKEYRANSGRAKQLQDRYWSSGYFGRGYVQLTFKRNYELAGSKIGADLVSQPDLALKPDYAAKILFSGMIEGWFTGAKLSDYLNERSNHYVAARKIVNGTDRARVIAGYAEAFEEALTRSRTTSDQLHRGLVSTETTGKAPLESSTILTAMGQGATAAGAIGFSSLQPVVAIALLLLVAGFTWWIIRERLRHAKEVGV